MRGHRIWLPLLVLIGLLLTPTPAPSKPYTVEVMMTALGLTDTDQISRWVSTTKEMRHLQCFVDLTAITGGGSVRLEILGCKMQETFTDSCVDATDALVWYQGSSLVAIDTDTVLLSPQIIAGSEATIADVKLVGPLPPRWAIAMNETGSTTLSYTVACAWW